MTAGKDVFPVMLKPRLLLRIEGAAVLCAACVLFQQSQGGWLWFGVLFLAPDFSMLGYLANKKAGAAAYNLAHTYTAPILMLFIMWFFGRTAHAWLAWIWLAHIGLDRLIGYGLKYETAFKDTHLQRV
jgi:hypothetical protein